MSERDVLLEQLDEMLGEGAVDADDALEIAVTAGLARRLDPTPHPALEAAEAWRDAGGIDLLTQAFDELDIEEILAGIDGVLTGEATEEEIEDALYELDDAVAAAIWCGQRRAVRLAAQAAAETIRDAPETFAFLADEAKTFARLRSVADDYDLYGYWFAIADAKAE